jgi:hypothetical protein
MTQKGQRQSEGQEPIVQPHVARQLFCLNPCRRGAGIIVAQEYSIEYPARGEDLQPAK